VVAYPRFCLPVSSDKGINAMKRNQIAAICVLAVLAAGCGKEEQTISTPSGDVKVSKQGATTTVEVKGGEKMKITAGDKGVALPATFPADVPMMPGAALKAVMTSGENLIVHYSIGASQAEAMKYYEENLKARGWKIEGTMNMGESAMVQAKKDKRDCIVTVVKESTGTSVQLALPNGKS
jgi:hypothetical protein